MERRIAWADSILDHIDSGIDVSQIDECLRLTPDQRLDKMVDFVQFLDGFERTGGEASGRRLPQAVPGTGRRSR